MATVIFDFDSTLITRESLEEILAAKLDGRPDAMDQVREITAQGMDGTLSFRESLARRLAIAAPSRHEVLHFGETAWTFLSAGMDSLIARLHDQGHRVWIISGGLREAILPVADRLGIPSAQVCAVRLLWEGDGSFAGIDPDDLFSCSKVEGLAQHKPRWDRPAVMVGDGMTDYRVAESGYADHFVAFTANCRRAAVVAAGTLEAADVNQLSDHLERLL